MFNLFKKKEKKSQFQLDLENSLGLETLISNLIKQIDERGYKLSFEMIYSYPFNDYRNNKYTYCYTLPKLLKRSPVYIHPFDIIMEGVGEETIMDNCEDVVSRELGISKDMVLGIFAGMQNREFTKPKNKSFELGRELGVRIYNLHKPLDINTP